jgi:sec-independent protein translocase protein TatB
MFDIGFSELMVIGIVALIVIGPERLPKVARTLGHLLGRAQRYVNDVKSDINREIQLDELKKLQSQVTDSARAGGFGAQGIRVSAQQHRGARPRRLSPNCRNGARLARRLPPGSRLTRASPAA